MEEGRTERTNLECLIGGAFGGAMAFLSGTANAQESPAEAAAKVFFDRPESSVAVIDDTLQEPSIGNLVISDPQHSEGPKLNTSVSLGVKSNYNASGFLVTDSPVIQGSVTFSHDNLPGWYGFLWGSANPRNDISKVFTEADVGIGKSFNITDGLDGSLEAAYFSFKLSDEIPIPDATNFTARVDTTNLPINVGFKMNQILGNESGNGQQYTGSIGKGFEITEGVSASLGADAVWNDSYFTDASGLAFLSGNVGLDTDVGNGWNLNLGYRMQHPMDEDTFGEAFGKNSTLGFTFSK
jgi:hypothetical protein